MKRQWTRDELADHWRALPLVGSSWVRTPPLTGLGLGCRVRERWRIKREDWRSSAMELIECIEDIAQNMESIGNLDGIGWVPTNSISDEETAVTRHDFGARMLM
jgi:hypothetical protein